MEELPSEVSAADIRSLITDKYDGDETVDISEDITRLAAGEPLAYVIGWIPFLGLKIELGSRPLIPRPETEWWTEECIAHLRERFGSTPFTVLDMCAGSGAIGISILSALPNATVYLAELDPAHTELIHKNIQANNLDQSRAVIHTSNLFSSFDPAIGRFSVIVTNPPYIPSSRILEKSVSDFEPALALFSGEDGLDAIREIVKDAPGFLQSSGELWLECDSAQTDTIQKLLLSHGAETAEIRTDLYGRPRLVVGYYR